MSNYAGSYVATRHFVAVAAYGPLICPSCLARSWYSVSGRVRIFAQHPPRGSGRVHRQSKAGERATYRPRPFSSTLPIEGDGRIKHPHRTRRPADQDHGATLRGRRTHSLTGGGGIPFCGRATISPRATSSTALSTFENRPGLKGHA